MTKSKSPKSDAKRPKSSKKAAEKKPAAPKKAPKEKAPRKPRGRTAVHIPEASAPVVAAPVAAVAPAAAPVVTEAESDAAFWVRMIPGEAISGDRLSRAIRYAAAVTPHKDGAVVFTRNYGDRPLISGHDERRCHTAFLPDGAAMLCDISVPRKDALQFADMLDGLSMPLVRISEGGTAHVTHGVGQYPVRFALGTAPITQRWEPPSQAGHAATVGPLRMKASGVAASCGWSKATVHQFQSREGIEWNTLTDEETGELLARAVLAEDGKDLFPQESRQTEFPNTRTAGTNSARMSRPVDAAMRDLKDTLAQSGMTMTVKVPGCEDVTLGGEAAPAPTAAEFSLETDAVEPETPPGAATLPEPSDDTIDLGAQAGEAAPQ